MRKPAVISVVFHLCVAFGLIAASMADPLPPPEASVQAAFAVVPMVAGDLGGGNTGDFAETSTDAGADAAPANEGAAVTPTQPAAVRQPPSVVPPTVEQLAEATPSHEPTEPVPSPVATPTEITPPVETTTEVPTEPEETTETTEPIVVEQIVTEPVVAPEPKPAPPVEVAVQPEATQPTPIEPVTRAVEPIETANAAAPSTNTEATQPAVTSGSDSALDAPSTGTGTQLAALPDATGASSGNNGADGGGAGGDPALEPGGGGALDDAAMEEYARLLGEWLDRHKEYPDRARKRNQQGVVLCEFTMAEDGAILSHRILESSGFPLLDEEVEALFERASPLPVPPAGADLTYTVPIVFALN